MDNTYEVASLQSKIDRQTVALDILNRKVLSQRFYFRMLRAMGKDLTREEYLQAKSEWEAERAPSDKDRLLEYDDLMKESELAVK